VSSAYVVEAVRSPIGKRRGGLADVHPVDLGAHALHALVARSGIDPGAVDDVLLGCLDQVGPQAGNIARTSWLAAGLPEHVPATTIDRQCGSSQQAVHFAAQAVLSGTQDVVVAGGVQHMSRVPIGTARSAGPTLEIGEPYGASGWTARYGTQEVSQYRAAELIAERWNVSRAAMEELAVASHERALRAREEGRFAREIAPLADVVHDEGPRVPDHDKIRALPALRDGGRTTAALASQISDGAAALLLCSERALRVHDLTPRARIHHMSVLAGDPIEMLSVPIPATRRALERAGMALDEIDLYEVNEAFAVVPLVWCRELGADPERLNVNGGALALGHPLGATGARLMTTLLHELERSGGRFGLQAMCEAGGQANVTILERL
jgi:acetyl-CoA C-acetyltransferase